MSNNCAIVLAAGEGKRMKSAQPKAMAEVLFQPMIDWVLDAVKASGISETALVVGHYGERLSGYIGDRCKVVWQKERLGTGHAVMQAAGFLQNTDAENVLILNGDAPFMDAETILRSLRNHEADNNAVTVITAKVPDPAGYGRIVRGTDGSLLRIVEEKDADDAERAITEINSGAFWFRREDLLSALGKLTTDNEAHEYYLTDTIQILRAAGKRTGASQSKNGNVVLGANDRYQLYQLNEIARKDVLRKQMEEGVDIPCIDGILIGKDVVIGNETTILPNSILRGKCVIGSGCTIGPNTLMTDSTVADGVTLNNVFLEQSVVDNGVSVGPFSHIRPDSHLGENVHVGNFVEIKNSSIGTGTKVPHLTYVGDSDVGAGCNFGCGSLTVNYDGKVKHRTTVRDHAFIGCNTNLIAPVTVGEYAFTAAGSSITEDVPDNALAIARARQVNKEEWVTKKKPYKGMN